MEAPCRRFACARANAGTSVFDVMFLTPAKHLAGQNHMVTCLRWSGEDFIVAGYDNTIFSFFTEFKFYFNSLKHSSIVNFADVMMDGLWCGTHPLS